MLKVLNPFAWLLGFSRSLCMPIEYIWDRSTECKAGISKVLWLSKRERGIEKRLMEELNGMSPEEMAAKIDSIIGSQPSA